jgi:DNA-binding NarL/FixJ family response regulator
MDVLRHVALGMDDCQIADELFVSTNTVQFHLKRIYLLLGIEHGNKRVLAALWWWERYER